MKKSFFSLLIGFGATLAIFVAIVMPPGGWAVAIGVLLGLMACIPLLLVVVLYIKRAHPAPPEPAPQQPQGYYPPMQGYYPPQMPQGYLPQPPQYIIMQQPQQQQPRRGLPPQQHNRQLQPPPQQRPVMRYYGEDYGIEEEDFYQ